MEKAHANTPTSTHNQNQYEVTKHYDAESKTWYYFTKINHKDENSNLIRLKHAHSIKKEGETVREFAIRSNSVLAFNASTAYITDDDERKASGMQIIDGLIVQDRPTTAYTLGIKENNELVSYLPGTSPRDMLRDGSVNALTGFMPLIVDHQPVSQNVLAIRGNTSVKHPRQAIAQYDNLDLLFMSVGGRGFDGAGMTSMDVIRILQKEGVKFAYMLDGGGSTTTVVEGHLITKKIDKHGTEERLRPNFLYVGGEAPAIHVTDVQFMETKYNDPTHVSGVTTVQVDGAMTDVPSTISGNDRVHVRVYAEGNELFQGDGLPATFPVNTWQLSEGINELTIEASHDDASLTVRKQTMVVRNIDVDLPGTGREHVHGTWPILLDVAIPDDLISGVRMFVDDRSIFTGHALPDNLTFDSTSFPDGRHTLTVQVDHRAGKSAERTFDFTIKNTWEMADAFLPPLSFFGSEMDRSETVETSSGWRYATDSPSSFFGDDSRMARDGNSEEYLVWEAPQLTQAVVTVYSRSGVVTPDDVVLSISSDGSVYEDIFYGVSVTDKNDDGWFQIQLIANPEEHIDSRYFRFLLRGTGEFHEGVQVGHVRLIGRK